jgi:hypothetical protein
MRVEQRSPGQTEAAHRRQSRPEKVYHVFTDGMDVWTGKRRKAEKLYRRLVRENGVARLYEERYRDRENEVMLSENCLKSYGGYPA